MIRTICPECHRQTPTKIYNDFSYWYCIFCKTKLSLKEVENLDAKHLDIVKTAYPQATHYIETIGEVTGGGPLVMEVPIVSKQSSFKRPRPKTYGLLLFQNDLRLGEVFIDSL